MSDSRIAAEWLGKARLARSSYLAAAAVSGEAMRATVSALEREYKRKSTSISLRTLERAQQRWLAIPPTGCLAQTVALNNRHLTISDVRVTGSTATRSDWSDDGTELGVCIINSALIARPKGMNWSALMLASVSLHALGRWFQRSLDNSSTALNADLRILAAAAPAAVLAGHAEVAVATGNGGGWHGRLASDGDGNVHVDVRTFH